MKTKYRYVHGIECTTCGDRVWSRHRHDMRYCSCELSFIDGGRDYTRVGFSAGPPRSVRIRVTNEEYSEASKYQPRWPY